MPRKFFYSHYEPHFHHVLKCLEAGRADNAVSWMVRDLGECGDLCLPRASSLKLNGNWIEFEVEEELVENVSGMGI